MWPGRGLAGMVFVVYDGPDSILRRKMPPPTGTDGPGGRPTRFRAKTCERLL
ncbi:hypothetical protein MTBSS4_90159 [Magnetospirillum sp. SS-4]|nr:hypothetical protein MTBSS4_90159 [Magnetospirillum sp. SS-4]